MGEERPQEMKVKTKRPLRKERQVSDDGALRWVVIVQAVKRDQVLDT